MEGAKNAYRGSQEVRRADTPNQGLSGRQEPRQPPAKPDCTERAATRWVVEDCEAFSGSDEF